MSRHVSGCAGGRTWGAMLQLEDSRNAFTNQHSTTILQGLDLITYGLIELTIIEREGTMRRCARPTAKDHSAHETSTANSRHRGDVVPPHGRSGVIFRGRALG